MLCSGKGKAPKLHKSMATNVMMQDAGWREVDAAVAALGCRPHSTKKERGGRGPAREKKRRGQGGGKNTHNASANAN